MAKITKKREITKDYLKECVVYGKHTGRFTWLTRPRSHFCSDSACSTWNSEFEGEKACRVDVSGYEIIQIDGLQLKAHHAAFILMTGNKPEEVDHENGVRSDNRWCNIRSVTRIENTKNRKLRSDNGSGYPGVSLRKDTGKWRAKISHNKKSITLGNFKTKEEAIIARQDAEKLYGYHENHGRVK